MQHQQCRGGGGGGGGGICPHNHNCVGSGLSGVSVYVAFVMSVVQRLSCQWCSLGGGGGGGGLGFKEISSSASLYASYHLNHSTANEDFSVGLNNTLVFNKSVKRKSFSVAITNDTSYESNEHFFVDLLVDAQGYNITLDPNSANITIIDDEGKFVFVCLFVF